MFNCGLLGLLGAMPVEEPFITASRAATVFYFLSFIFIFYFSRLENNHVLKILDVHRKNIN